MGRRAAELSIAGSHSTGSPKEVCYGFGLCGKDGSLNQAGLESERCEPSML